MQGQAASGFATRGVGFSRAFVLSASAWIVAQGHHGVFLNGWTSEASLAGNACWILILYCQLRLALDWFGAARLSRRVDPELSMQMLAIVTLELASMASGNPLARPEFGQLMFFCQPLILLCGFAALHRRQPQRV